MEGSNLKKVKKDNFIINLSPPTVFNQSHLNFTIYSFLLIKSFESENFFREKVICALTLPIPPFNKRMN